MGVGVWRNTLPLLQTPCGLGGGRGGGNTQPLLQAPCGWEQGIQHGVGWVGCESEWERDGLQMIHKL